MIFLVHMTIDKLSNYQHLLLLIICSQSIPICDNHSPFNKLLVNDYIYLLSNKSNKGAMPYTRSHSNCQLLVFSNGWRELCLDYRPRRTAAAADVEPLQSQVIFPQRVKAIYLSNANMTFTFSPTELFWTPQSKLRKAR